MIVQNVQNSKNKKGSDNLSKNEDYKFIRSFVDIKINKICKDNKIDSANVLNGKASDENIKKVKNILDYNIKKIYLDEISERIIDEQ